MRLQLETVGWVGECLGGVGVVVWGANTVTNIALELDIFTFIKKSEKLLLLSKLLLRLPFNLKRYLGADKCILHSPNSHCTQAFSLWNHIIDTHIMSLKLLPAAVTGGTFS